MDCNNLPLKPVAFIRIAETAVTARYCAVSENVVIGVATTAGTAASFHMGQRDGKIAV